MDASWNSNLEVHYVVIPLFNRAIQKRYSNKEKKQKIYNIRT